MHAQLYKYFSSPRHAPIILLSNPRKTPRLSTTAAPNKTF